MSGFMSLFLTIICLLSFYSLQLNANEANLETYIVHVEGSDRTQLSTDQSNDLEGWYRSFLPPTMATSTDGSERIIYSYRSVFKGFAASLSPEEVKAMESIDGFVSARPQKKLSLHTTHSPNFLGLNRNTGFWESSNYGKGVIIGVLDTGVFPEHPSFNDEGMPPPPTKWKGNCEFNHTTCNNKIIGARYFRRGVGQSPLDDQGHGTHTASTAAGNFVRGANLFGNANGTAVGIAPLAHLAIYKVCSTFCSESDILAAMDAAIEDGVDVLSLSLGGFSSSFYDDSIALGAFSAMEKGILVSCSAGNDGPSNFSLSNEAPWILTVGASTIDRKIRATAVLGNNETFDGESAFQPSSFPSTPMPLVYAGMLNTSDLSLPFCAAASLNRTDVGGKIVVCELGVTTRVAKGIAVKNAGGAGMILVNSVQYANMTYSDAHVLPVTHVCYADGLKIKTYVNSTSKPTATIVFKGTEIGDDRTPVVAAFSSRGPNFVSRGILKPDILGPGVNILSAWPNSIENNTNTNSTFNIISGTSMSCPHLSGVAALLKSVHPDWSPAAIKSAIMTTADVVNLAQNPIEDERFLPASIFATGSGHVNPSKANNPGLIYDIRPQDYIPYLCGLNYTNRQVGAILQRKVNCSDETSIPEAQLNYPSFALTFSSLQPATQTYTRTVTNVGEANSSYVVEIVPPPGIDVRVEPEKLELSEVNQKMQYNVTFSRLATASNNTVVQGFLKWNSSKYSVRSPIAVILR